LTLPFFSTYDNHGFFQIEPSIVHQLVRNELGIAVTSNSFGWSPGIGDPTFIAWLTVCAYFLAAILCFSAYRHCQQPSNAEICNKDLTVARWIWLGLFLFFLFLGINKQLDLQTLFIIIGRNVARQQGWFAERRKYQELFVVVLSLASIMVLITFALIFRSVGAAERFALLGAAVVMTFVLVRASSMCHEELFACSRQFGRKLNWALEWIGIATVFSAALLRQAQGSKRVS
jgi:hypothetical protein